MAYFVCFLFMKKANGILWGKAFRLQIILIMRCIEKPGSEVSSVCMQLN